MDETLESDLYLLSCIIIRLISSIPVYVSISYLNIGMAGVMMRMMIMVFVDRILSQDTLLQQMSIMVLSTTMR